MNWYSDIGNFTQGVDTWISSSIYGSDIDTDGIDLRRELHGILYGFPGKNPLGHWVVLRHFDRTKPSKYYNRYSNEGLAGPKWEYTDTLVKTRRMPAPRSDTEDAQKIGDVFSDKLIYYFEYNVTVSKGDQIYELDWADHRVKPPTTRSANYVEKFDIKRLHAYRMDHGNIAYFAALAEFNNITY